MHLLMQITLLNLVSMDSVNICLHPIGVFIDLITAFETIDHELICEQNISVFSDMWHTIG